MKRQLTGYMLRIGFFLISVLICFLVLLLSGSMQYGGGVRADAPLDEFKAHMNARIPALMNRYGIPGCAVAVVKDCDIAWTEAYGYADIASGTKLTIDTPMSVQSITKSITAWGVMRLTQKGLIDLDAPVSQYLKNWQFPQSRYRTDKITARHLLSHTAGMPLGDFTKVYAPGDTMPSNRDVMSEEAVQTREAGTGFSYSNTGYNILEILIEYVTEQSFSDYIRSEIMLPLGMESAVFEIESTMTPYPPTGYNLSKKAVPVYLYPSKASGGLFATVTDIARFAAMGMKENTVLSDESIELLYTPQSQNIGIYGLVFEAYGFGHYIETLPNGAKSISHGGQGNGIMTHFQAVPDSGDAIVILTNSQRGWPFIAYVLCDWARWRGFSSVGMGRIIWAHYALSIVVGIIISASLLVIIKLILNFFQKKRPKFRLLRVSMSAIILTVLIWCACQKYLFITSVFPILCMWLAGAAILFAVSLLLSALLPAIKALIRNTKINHRRILL